MLSHQMQIRPRYGEVDQMGYVYHANYVSYCHQARTELLRTFKIDDAALDAQDVILPVISFEISYKKAAYYDEILRVKVIVNKMPDVRFNFDFEIYNKEDDLVTTAKSTVVFADKKTRYPMNIPDFVEAKLLPYFSGIKDLIE